MTCWSLACRLFCSVDQLGRLKARGYGADVVLHTNCKRSRAYGFVGWVGFQETYWPGSNDQVAPPVTLWYAEFGALMGGVDHAAKVSSKRRSLLLDSSDEPGVGGNFLVRERGC